MKYPLLLCIFLIATSFVAAQVPQAINYQAIARTSTGAPIVNATIGVRFKILQTSATGNSVYSETHAPTTNQVGLFNLQIGNGGNQVGVFANINWGSGAYFLEVAIDPAGGTNYQVVGTPSQFLSVPYALRAPAGTRLEDSDADTWVSVVPIGRDTDQIHMSLGLSEGGPPGIPGPTVLILRRNNPVGKNTMLELIDGNPLNARNIFIGQSAGNSNKTGQVNTIVGWQSFADNYWGGQNSAFGHEALRSNFSGSRNTGMGHQSLYYNANGNYNTAYGSEALYKDTASNNTAMGYHALYENTNGASNAAVGDSALHNNKIGNYNTALGSNALQNNVNGNYNTALGHLADVGVGLGSLTHSTAIGVNAKVMTSHAMILGDSVNVGIGLSGDVVGPANKLEINSNIPGASGLRFRALANYTPPVSTPAAVNVLTVNPAGDVILVPSGSGGPGTGGWLLNGNPSVISTDFLGTINAEPLRFKVFDEKAGLIHQNGPLFLGYRAGDNNTNTTPLTNTGIGYQALFSNIIGKENTATGYQALFKNTGSGNTAMGTKAMLTNAGGGNNTAVGFEALRDNQTGQANTASGVWAMHENTIGQYNTAYGAFTMQHNKTGGANTAMGVDALDQNIAGSNNTAIGVAALQKSTGSDNTAVGWHALTNNVAENNTAIGVNALELNKAGYLNTATGFNALKSNDSGFQNTANGVSALEANILGIRNTAVGASALRMNTASDNTATGTGALEMNTGGTYNTAMGVFALNANKLGRENTALGALALQKNDRGFGNTALGKSALNANVGGSTNTAIGVEAMLVSDAGENTAVGYRALASNVMGTSNAGVGYGALSNNVNGRNNSALGAGAGVATGNLLYATAIGAGAVATADNQMRLGNASIKEVIPGNDCMADLGNISFRWNKIWACNPLMISSDSILKSNILNIKYGLDDVMRLRPVEYHWKNNVVKDKILGFIAQEVEHIVPEAVVPPTNDQEYYAMKYDVLIPVLTRAIQEQQAQIETLKTQNAQLETIKQQNQSLQGQLDQLRADLQFFRASLEKQAGQTNNRNR